MSWLELDSHHRWLEAETARLLSFSRGSVLRDGGFGWLDDAGRPVMDRHLQLWVGCRMTHVFALGHLLGWPGCGPLVDHGIRALRERFEDPVHGGWYAAVGDSGPVARGKTAYEHAFVVLAASSAVAADRDGAEELLRDALAVLGERFWDEEQGMVVDEWDEAFTRVDPYRGMNSNMHTVEAMLAASDVTGDPSYAARAGRITARAYRSARENQWRLQEHHDEKWVPIPDYNVEDPAHAFRPFGATVGHSLEWARLGVQVAATLGAAAPAGLVADAVRLFDAAVEDGWSRDGSPGFVYTVDWSGRPVVRQRMHWVAAEATAAAYALWSVTGEDRFARRYEEWWDHIVSSFLDPAGGSWWHELDPGLRPSTQTWSGKPDAYHAVQATLAPRLPVAPSYATALRRGLLDRGDGPPA